MKLKHFVFFLIPLLIIACDSKDDPISPCSTILPPAPITAFMLIDNTSGEPLIGVNKAYNIDSVNLLNTFPPFRVDDEQDSIVELNFANVVSGSDLLFKLSETEVDTIKIIFRTRKTECFETKELEEFYYNNKLIKPENKPYIIRK